MTATADRALDERSLVWLRQQIKLGADISICVLELRRLGFSDRAIVVGLEKVRPRGNAMANGAMQSLPLFRRAPAGLRRLDAAPFPLYTLDDFMSADECTRLIGMIDPILIASPLAHDTYDREFRTSRTAFLRTLRSPVVDAFDARVCSTLGINASYSEGIQVQHYQPGQQFKPHWDYFEPGTNTFERHAGIRGNRTWTFMVYLNDGMEGGATRFTEIDHAVQPKTGMALIWNNLHPDGSPNVATRHCGEPVTRGNKVIITKWFRVHGDGPVLND
jgi:prolyl 4-hydroxylase